MKYDILIANDVETERAGKDQEEDFSKKGRIRLSYSDVLHGDWKI